jgi:hypothetical protein
LSQREKILSDDEDAIYIDARQPATLHFAGKTLDCPTLREAVIAWHKLPVQDQEEATIRTSGAVYTADDISRLRYA